MIESLGLDTKVLRRSMRVEIEPSCDAALVGAQPSFDVAERGVQVRDIGYEISML